MAVSIEMIKALREESGAGVLDCKKALEVSQGDFDKAVAYLRERGLSAAAKKASRDARDGLVSLFVDSAGQRGAIVEVNCETDFVARTEDFRSFANVLLTRIREEPEVDDLVTLLSRPYLSDASTTIEQKIVDLVAKLGEKMMVQRFANVRRDGPGWIEGYVHPGNRIGVLLVVSVSDPDVAEGAAFRELAHDLALQVAASAPKYVAPSDIPNEVLAVERAKFLAQVSDEKKPDNLKERIVSGKLEKWYESICLLRQPFIKDDSLRVADLIENRSKSWGSPVTVERFVRYELGADA